MAKCKTIAIQKELGTFRHNQAYPGIIQSYSKPCVTLAYFEPWYIQNPHIFKIRNIFRTLVYSEPQYIQNYGIFKIQGLFRHLRFQTSTMKRFSKIVKGKQLRSISLPRPLLHEKNIMRQLLQMQLLYVKKLWRARVPEIVNFLYTYVQTNQPICSQ